VGTAVLQAAAKKDQCARFPVPALTERKAEEIRKRRRKLDCKAPAAKGVFRASWRAAAARFAQVGLGSEPVPMPSEAEILAQREQALCVYYKGDPEMPEEFFRCRQSALAQGEKRLSRAWLETVRQKASPVRAPVQRKHLPIRAP
jgi:hypothetical protein